MNVAKERGFMRIVVVILFGVILLFGCDSGTSGGSKSVEQLILDKTELTIVISEEGPESEALKVTVTPAKANYGSLNWSSSNEKIVTVDKSGKVTALSAGEAVVTVQSENGKKATCKISVYLGSTKLEFSWNENRGFYSVKGIGSETGSTIAIPPKYQGKLVGVIGEGAFQERKDLTRIIIPDSVKIIEKSAFDHCRSLKDMELPNSVGAIGENAFSGCTSLTRIVIPNSVKIIGSNAFFECTSLKSIELPNSIGVIENNVFSGCTSLNSVVIPDSVEVIENNAFRDCTSLNNIAIPNSVRKIGDGAFSGCESLSSIVIPCSVKVIEDRVFSGCSNLSSITIPKSVIRIGECAFEGCTSLNSVIIPDSVITMGEDIFYHCDSSFLKVFYEGAKIPDGWDENWDLLDKKTRVKVECLGQK